MGAMWNAFWLWVWSIFSWASNSDKVLTVSLMLSCIGAIYAQTRHREVPKVLSLALVVLLGIAALFHSWLAQHDEALKQRRILAGYERKVNHAAVIIQPFVTARSGLATWTWVPCGVRGVAAVCGVEAAFFVSVTNIHDSYDITVDKVTARMHYDGRWYSLVRAPSQVIFYGRQPSVGVNPILNGYNLQTSGAVLPHGNVQGFVLFYYPPNVFVVHKPDTIVLTFTDSAGLDFPATWHSSDSDFIADPNYSLLRVPQLQLGPAVRFHRWGVL